MLKSFFISVYILCMAFIAQARDNIDGRILVGNTQREYSLHLPKKYKPGALLPLVLVFHGGGGNYKQIRR